MWVKERNERKNKEKCVNRAIVPDSYFIGDIVKNTLDDPPRNTVGTFFGNILNFPTHFLIRKSPGNTVNGLNTSQAGNISVKLAGKILNVLEIFWVGIG